MSSRFDFIKNPYLRFTILLLITVYLIAGALWSTGCGGCLPSSTYYHYSTSSSTTTGTGLPFTGHLIRSETKSYMNPKARVNRFIHLKSNTSGETPPGTVTYSWTPPKGATNVFIDHPSTPTGPPYVISNAHPDEVIQVSYNMPDIPQGQSQYTAVESLQTSYTKNGQDQSTTVKLETKITEIGGGTANSSPPVNLKPAQTDDWWGVEHFIDIKGITLTTTLCQDWFEVLPTEDYFVAVRMPEPTVPITQSVPLPFIFGDTYSQTVHLMDYNSFTILMTMTVEYRPDRFDFVANELPAVEGEQWVPLGLKDSQPASCPTGLDVTPNEWGLIYEGLVDLSHAPDNCKGCILPLYYCYEGQNAPGNSAAAAALGRLMGMAGLDIAAFDNIQAEGITCLGPHSFPLNEPFPQPDLSLEGGGVTQLDPPGAAEFEHFLFGTVGTTADITYTSTISGPWLMYENTYMSGEAQPDWTKPLTPPLVIPSSGLLHFWMVNDDIPAATVTGPHNLVITASLVSDPDTTNWAVDTLWVGDWVAPPEATRGEQSVYLPFILK